MAFYAESQCFRPRFFRFFARRYKLVLQVSGTGTAFKEAVSFELAEEELWDAPGPVDPTFSAICRVQRVSDCFQQELRFQEQVRT
jgi:hypothetical protein